MPRKMARSAPRTPSELPKALVTVDTARRSCGKAGKAQIFTPSRGSSGESRISCWRRPISKGHRHQCRIAC